MNKQQPIPAVMNVEKGETIVGTWVTPTIPTVGFYKLLAKKKKDGMCEWVHFVQRLNGEKAGFYRGEVNSEKDLETVVVTINRVLSKTFGTTIQLQQANVDVFSLDGKELGNTSVH